MICAKKFKKTVGVGLAVVALSMSGAEAATAAPSNPRCRAPQGFLASPVRRGLSRSASHS
jgi:hypothetical protein